VGDRPYVVGEEGLELVLVADFVVADQDVWVWGEKEVAVAGVVVVAGLQLDEVL
jgi:myosin-crossreactive antigen